MKKILANGLTVMIILGLIISTLIICPFNLTSLQKETLFILLIICGISFLFCFIVGEITRNNSQMDKLWSIMPVIYIFVIFLYSSINNGFNIRLFFIFLLIFIWGARLTYNFAKKGGYSLKFWAGEEDYRWAFLRKNKYFQNKFIWGIFDLFFISFYQNFLVLLITLPAVSVMHDTTFNIFDLIPIVLIIAFILLETIADNEQRIFYKKRKELMSDGTLLKDIEPPFNKGFNTSGIFKFCRHPNYFAEQAIWVCLYLFTITANVNKYYIFNLSIIGCLLLILLFMGSSTLGEAISSSKYPLYKDYIKTTSKYIPWFSKKK